MGKIMSFQCSVISWRSIVPKIGRTALFGTFRYPIRPGCGFSREGFEGSEGRESGYLMLRVVSLADFQPVLTSGGARSICWFRVHYFRKYTEGVGQLRG